MRPRVTLMLLVTVLIVGGLIVIVERDADSTVERHIRANRLFSNGLADVDKLTLLADGWRAECRRHDGDWTIVRPIAACAHAGVVEQILGSLEGMTRTETITTQQRRLRELDLQDFGFSKTNWTLSVSDGVQRHDLRIGARAPVGDGLYVRVIGEDGVVLSQSALLDVLPASLEALRDRALVRGETTRTSKLTIEREGGGFIQLVQHAGEWTIQQPARYAADRTAINGILDVLYGATAQRFVWDRPLPWGSDEPLAVAEGGDSGARREAYGLAPDTARARITVWGAEDDTGTELLLGKDAEEAGLEIYAKLRDSDSVVTTDAALLAAFDVTVNDLRSRTLFAVDPREVNYLEFENDAAKLVLLRDPIRGWMLHEPVQWKADEETVASVLNMLLGLRIDRFLEGERTQGDGQDPAPAMVRVCMGSGTRPVPSDGDADPSENNEVRSATSSFLKCVEFGERGSRTNSVVASYEGDETWFELTPPLPGPESARWTQPLVFRDRTVLSLEPASVTRLVLHREGAAQVVTRAENGTWRTDPPELGTVAFDTVADVLYHAAHLRALRIETGNLKDLAAYGLDPVTMELTFGLSGKEEIQLSLRLGFRAGTDGIYAMVQGEDVIFVLSAKVVAVLTRDLLAPSSGSE